MRRNFTHVMNYVSYYCDFVSGVMLLVNHREITLFPRYSTNQRFMRLGKDQNRHRSEASCVLAVATAQGDMR